MGQVVSKELHPVPAHGGVGHLSTDCFLSNSAGGYSRPVLQHNLNGNELLVHNLVTV